MKRLVLFAAMAMIALAPLVMPLASTAGGKKGPGKADYDNLTYIPTADEVILKMFEMAKLKKDDVIFDLGCGDGRILYMAARKFGCRGVGLDINPDRIVEAMDLARKYEDVSSLVEIRHGDALKPKDLSDATVVMLYMFPEFMNLWAPIAKEKLKPGTRILSHDYAWKGDWVPDKTVAVRSSTRDHKVHLWVVK